MDEQRQTASGTNRIAAALAELSRRAENLASLSATLTYLLILVPLAACAVLFLAVNAAGAEYGPLQRQLMELRESGRLPWLYLGLVAWSTLLAIAALGYSALARSAIRRSLEASELAGRIAAGLLDNDQLSEYTPAPWRLLLPRGSGLAAGLWRIACNLDWYLAAPKRLWRTSWLFNLLWLCITVLAIPAALIFDNWLPALGSLLCAVAASFVQHRRQLWAAELARYLRSRLEE